MTLNLGTILTAMVTPFDGSGALDEAATVRLVHHLLDSGSDGLVVCGTTGEASTLDEDEQLRMIELVVSEVRAAYPFGTVVAGVGSNNTRHAVKLTQRVTALRPDGLLAVNPYYNRPSRRGVIRHFQEMNAATDLPIVLYNIPQRTGSDMPNDLLAELALLTNVVAIKQANPANLAMIDGLELYAGNDDSVIDVLNMGGRGGVCTLTHVFGAQFRQMVEQPERRAEIHASLSDAYRNFGIAPLAVTNKAALNLLGIGVGGPRLPYVGLDQEETAVIRGVLERHGLLEATSA